MKSCLCILAIIILLSTHLFASDANWPQWRGPLGNGYAPDGDPPIEWSEQKNIKWKVEIPGKGHSSPIVWGDQLFLTASIETDKAVEMPASAEGEQRSWMKPVKSDKIHQFVVYSIDRHTGKIQWQTTVRETHPADHTHELGSWASNSPVTDGKHVWAYFGSRGLYCLDLQGKLQWERDLGDLQKSNSFGEGSSPVLYQDKIFIQWDHEGADFLFALDKNSGKDIWKVERDERSSWSTPLIVEFQGKTQLVTSATNRVRSYDPATGKLLWECGGLTGIVIPVCRCL
ncbi:PQQ-binding-like beta-propeller repeat protein [candidate division KSB1 bacterium]|nr:PQQ-binding-like beta-propeller repeat protein [candidate division KSB1 bacterium]